MVPIDNGEGREGRVFKYENLAVKIFKYPVYQHQEDGYDFLMNLKANRFVLIKDKFYEQNMMQGFIMDYIENKKSRFEHVNMTTLLSDLTLIKKDLLMFKENKVWLTDVHMGNIMFNGNLYIIDTNSYLPLDVYTELNDDTCTEEQMKNIIYQDNLYMINEGLLKFLSAHLNLREFTIQEQHSIYDNIINSVGDNYIGDFLKEDAKGCSTWQAYAKKKLS